MAETSLSLDEIIKKNNIQTFKKRNINTVKRFGKRLTNTSFASKNKVITDVRNKIIQKKRMKIGDARERLGQIAKQGDARDRLNKLKKSKLNVSNTRIGGNIGATNTSIQGRNLTRTVTKFGDRPSRKPIGAPRNIQGRNLTRTTPNTEGRPSRNPIAAAKRRAPRDLPERNPNVRMQQLAPLQSQRMRPTMVRESRYPKEQVYRQTRPVAVRETRPMVVRDTYVSKYDDPISYRDSGFVDEYEEPESYRERLYVDEYGEPIRKRDREYVNEYVDRTYKRDRVYNEERDVSIRNRDVGYVNGREEPIRNRNRVYDDESYEPIRTRDRVYDDERDAPRRTKPIYPKTPMMSSSMASRLEQEQPRPQQGQKIVVANLHPCVCAEDIEELFGTIGTIIKSRMVEEGVATVVFLKRQDALKAVEVFHNRQLDGLAMKVNLVRRK